MLVIELVENVSITLTHLHVRHKRREIRRGASVQFIIDDFGLVINCIEMADYTQVRDIMEKDFQDWAPLFVTTTDELRKIKDKILWALMRRGYMKWLRSTFPRQVINTLNGPENLGRRIIEERLRIWGNKPMYNFFIQDNMEVLRYGIVRELNNDPGFFDYMPEEDI